MANYFPPIEPSDTLKESRKLLLARDTASLSNFSGENFPLEEYYKGQLFYKTDFKILYIAQEGTEGRAGQEDDWVILFELGDRPVQTSTDLFRRVAAEVPASRVSSEEITIPENLMRDISGINLQQIITRLLLVLDAKPETHIGVGPPLDSRGKIGDIYFEQEQEDV